MIETYPSSGSPLTHCVTHPEVETTLACGRCGKPICPRCLVQTPVGARCRGCARPRRLPTFEVTLRHYAIGSAVGLSLALLSGLVWAFLPRGGFLGIIVALGVGYGIGETISRAVNRKRSLGLQIIAGGAVLLSFWASLVLPMAAAVLGSGAAGDSVVVGGALALRSLGGILVNPFAWLVVGAGAFMAVVRLR